MKKFISLLVCLLISVPLFASNSSKFLVGSLLILSSVYGGEHQFNLRDKSNNTKTQSDIAFTLADTYKTSNPLLFDSYTASANDYLNDSKNYDQDMKNYQVASAALLAIGTYLTSSAAINMRKDTQKTKPQFNSYQFFGGFLALGQAALFYDAARDSDNITVRSLNVFCSTTMFALGTGCISNNIDILVGTNNIVLSYKF